jgi:pteridine reductase
MESVRVPKVALITGSGRRRVGSVVAEYLARAGYNIALHYHRSADSANELTDSIQRLGVNCHAFQADVANEADVEQMFEAVAATFGRLDVLVTTASVWDAGKLEDITVEDVMRSYSVNAVGTFLCARRAGLLMVEQSEGGAIVTIGDWAIQRPYLDHVAYFMAKGSVEALTRSLAVELAHRNPKVRVNCVHPGPVMFPPNISKQEREMLVESTLVKSGDCPESIGRAVLFLAEDNFVTGVCLPVDGGRTIFASESTSRKRPI